MRQFDTFRFDSDKVAVEITKNINKVKYYETNYNINVEYVGEVRLCENAKYLGYVEEEDAEYWEHNDYYFINLDNDVPEAIAKMIASSLQSYAGGKTEIFTNEDFEDNINYAVIWYPEN